MTALYLDHAATSPLLPAARAAWLEAAAQVGNPSSLHGPGRAARAILEAARERIAATVGAEPAEVIVTSGGTEADNLAVLGGARARRAEDDRRRRVLVSSIEHHAVLEPARALRAEGFDCVELPVDPDGRVNLGFARAALEQDPAGTALLSVMWVNNETGAIQPVAELAELAAEFGVPCHSDAVQAGYVWGRTLCHPERSEGSRPGGGEILRCAQDDRGAWPGAVSLSGHKVGAPVGVGVLVARRGFPLQPIAYGGGQERRLRSGTLSAPLLAAFAAALDQTVTTRDAEAARLRALSDRLVTGLAALDGVTVVGPLDPALRSPHIVNALFHGCLGEDLLLLLDAAGIACSTGAACTAGVLQPSHVLIALGYPAAREARWGLRFSFGPGSADGDVDAVLAALPGAIAAARASARAAGEWD